MGFQLIFLFGKARMQFTEKTSNLECLFWCKIEIVGNRDVHNISIAHFSLSDECRVEIWTARSVSSNYLQTFQVLPDTLRSMDLARNKFDTRNALSFELLFLLPSEL